MINDLSEMRLNYHNINLPSEIALTKIVNDKIKMIKDALPRMAINLLTRTCPAKAANVATATK